MVDLFTVRVPPRLKEGIALVEQGKFKQAQDIFEGYLEVEQDSALALSYAGYLESKVSGRPEEGLERCIKARRLDPREALMYLNLSRAYLAVGNRYQCVKALEKGLKIPSPHHEKLERFLNVIGVRRRPLIGFLDRNHPINDLWGRLTWKLKRHG